MRGGGVALDFLQHNCVSCDTSSRLASTHEQNSRRAPFNRTEVEKAAPQRCLFGLSIRNADGIVLVDFGEFALIVDSIAPDQALRKMQSLDRTIRESVCRYGDNILPITASMGCTAIDADDTEFKVIARADSAMYRHKRERRTAAA
ncbi:MAG: hypothetical protein B7Z55_02155 [Planctomycetales bacterium 12-60-4]|nr:MAG: hypothetical protein B7Z55_02155 [Planctomycetales bacterium 12-60-4]